MAGLAQELVTTCLCAAAAPLLLIALYLAVLALAAPAKRRRGPAASSSIRVAILVPAHNEELLVASCVRSLLVQHYPAHLRVVVVADNCTDHTAERAREAGAEVMVRSDPARGKGRALGWAIDNLLAEPVPPDAVAVVDADSVAHPDLVDHLVAGLSASMAVQGLYLALPEPGSRRSRMVALGFQLFHRVRLGGRARLGLPAAMVGNGMLFASELLRRHPWAAFSGVEDLELTLQLRLAGIRPAFASDAMVFGPVASLAADTMSQRRRWEGGRLHAMRAWLPRLVAESVRRRDLSLLDALLDLAVPPLSMLVTAVVAGLLLSALASAAGLAPVWTVALWAAPLLLVATFVVGGVLRAGLPISELLLLIEAPAFLLLKLGLYARLACNFDPAEWTRSRREGERPSQQRDSRRPVVGGIPIDALTIEEARHALRQAMGTRRLHHVATVNMDFISRSQRDPLVRSVFGRTHLNLPDGAPVVWLGRLTGQHIPERVAGADLVPLIVADAADRGAGVFLLGGENGVAHAAASALVARHPALRICGVLEPARASVEELESEAILQQITDSGADVLLVALGHPKQDLWIDRHRERLPVSIAVGVGCVFDLLAGRATRAPRWMQRAGLEWLYRVAHEPARLGGRYATNLRCLLVLASKSVVLRASSRRQVA